MNYNDILRRLRYSFDFSDEQMIKIFEMGGLKTDRATVSNWMKKEEADDYEELVAKNLTMYLNGLISFKRGERPGGPPKPEKYLTNNLILKKLKIALELSTEDILEMYILSGKTISMNELTSFFRNPERRQFQPMKDQYLRQFIYAIQHKFRPSEEE